jgi:serine/threonine-protein kinase
MGGIMKLRGPYITMVAGLAAAALLGVMSGNAVSDQEERLAAVQAGNNAPSADAPTELEPTQAADPPLDPIDPAEATTQPADPPDEEAPAKPRKAVYAGRTENRQATVAVSVKNDKAIAYVCDGKKLEAWLSGTVKGNQVTLSGEGNATLNAEIQGNRLIGTVAAKKKSYDFNIKTVKKPSGLYQAASNVAGARVVGSWIRLEDGTLVGVLTEDGEPGPAPAFDVDDGTVDVEGGSLTVMPVGPDGNTEE